MTVPRLLALVCALMIVAVVPVTARATITIIAQGGAIEPQDFATSDGSDGGGEQTDRETIPNLPGAATATVAGNPGGASAMSSVGSAHAAVSSSLHVSSTVSQTSGMVFSSTMSSGGSASTHRTTADDEAARAMEATAGDEGGSSIQFTIDVPMNYTLSGGTSNDVSADSPESDESIRFNGPSGAIATAGTGQGVSASGLLPAGGYSLTSEAFMNLTAGSPNTAGASKGASGAVGFDVTLGLTPAPDSDGDGLPDAWETDGIDVDGDGAIDLDLPTMGADPQHKDIFLELDAMAGHGIDQSAIDDVVQAFADAPVSNPDGTDGITLHVDNGPTSVMDPTTGTQWGNLSDHDVLPHQQVLGTEVNDDYNWSAFDARKAVNFSPTRRPAFHYAISAHQFGAPGERATGISRGIVAADFLIATGFCSPDLANDCRRGDRTDAGVLMHELGHNLGLRHGGTDDVNYKPNYLSIMNYDFTFSWLPQSSGSNVLDVLDYSRFDLSSLDENALDEDQGLGAPIGSDAAAFSTVDWCAPGVGALAPVRVHQVDFNCDGQRGGVVGADVNRDNLRTTLTGPDDWSRLVYKGGGIGSLAPPVVPTSTPQNEAPVTELLADEAVVDAGIPPAPGPVTTPSPPAGPAPATPAAPAPRRATCTLRPTSTRVALRGAARGRLTLAARCDGDAKLTLRTTIATTRRVHRRRHTTKVSLKSVTARARAKTAVTIRVTLPRAVLRALARHDGASATLALQVTSAGGVRTVTVRIAHLQAKSGR